MLFALLVLVYLLCFTYVPTNISGIKSSSHSASFTLAPTTSPSSEPPSFASVFEGGYHYRLDGLEVTLEGALPTLSALQKNGEVEVELQISTSGAYSDISEDKRIFQFVSMHQSKRFSYKLLEDGQQGDVTVRAIFETKDHAEPTPFTQWTIKLLHPDRVNLDGLTGLHLQWAGHARFSDAMKRDKASRG